MFEIVSDTAMERLKLIFPNKTARTEFVKENKGNYTIKSGISKIIFDIKHLENFQKRFSNYQVELYCEKKNFGNPHPTSFGVWGVVADRELGESAYIFSKLDEVQKEID